MIVNRESFIPNVKKEIAVERNLEKLLILRKDRQANFNHDRSGATITDYDVAYNFTKVLFPTRLLSILLNTSTM